MSAILEVSSIKEASGNEAAEEMVQTITNDFSILTSELKEAMSVAEEADDETTGDMLLGIHQSLEKHNWMLKSFLG